MSLVDYILPIVIVGGLVLTIICKATGQTVPELFRDIKDFFTEVKEDSEDEFIGVYDH